MSTRATVQQIQLCCPPCYPPSNKSFTARSGAAVDLLTGQSSMINYGSTVGSFWPHAELSLNP